MQLTRWNPRHHLRQRSTFFPGRMDDFFGPFGGPETARLNEFMPSVDIYEKDEKVYFEAEVPGFNKEDLQVDVESNVITISGERKIETSDDEHRLRKERRYGKFSRSFRLGFEAESNAVEAKYENGILTVVIAKPQEQQAKRIAIN